MLIKESYLLLAFPGFPFYTIGRFSNDLCRGNNLLIGTCQINGECTDNNGVAAGSCSSITNQAVCCICKYTTGRGKPFGLGLSRSFFLQFNALAAPAPAATTLTSITTTILRPMPAVDAVP